MQILFTAKGNNETSRTRLRALTEFLQPENHELRSAYKRMLWTIWYRQPHIVHVHGSPSLIWMKLARLATEKCFFILTVSDTDSLPEDKVLAQFAAVVAVSRTVQYRLLVERNVKAAYIPDGYMPVIAAPVALEHFGVRSGQYCVTTAQTYEEIKWVAQSYASAKTKKKLAVFAEDRGHLKRLKRRYPFLLFVGEWGMRPQLSLMSEAALVIVAHNRLSGNVLLQIMDAGRAIVAVGAPHYEEILGVTGKFVTAGDLEGLGASVRDFVGDARLQRRFGKEARLRARKHFTWENAAGQYMRLYSQPKVRSVPLDSIRPLYHAERLAV